MRMISATIEVPACFHCMEAIPSWRICQSLFCDHCKGRLEKLHTERGYSDLGAVRISWRAVEVK